MAAIEYLSADTKSALRKGRAIPMLVEHHPPEMPDHALTVIGLLDTRTFEGVFVPDDFTGGKLVSMALPECQFDLFDIKTDSDDAKAVHELWTQWHGGGCERYLGFVRAVALSLSLEQLRTALETATPVAVTSTTSSGQSARSKRATSKGSRTKNERPEPRAHRKTRVSAKARKQQRR